MVVCFCLIFLKAQDINNGIANNFVSLVVDILCNMQGPFLKTTKTLLHRTFGDENILIVKFEEQARGGSSIISGDHNAFYGRVAKEGILVGQRRYRFFGNTF